MKMNANKIYNMCRYLLTSRIYQFLGKVKYNTLSTRNIRKVLVCSTLTAIATSETKTEKLKEVVSTDHRELLLQEFLDIEEKLKELIKNLQIAMCETSEKYRQCLEKQIYLITKGSSVDPNSEYWDQIVELRNEAEDFKREFENFKNMVQFVGQTALNLALCTASINVEDSQKFLCSDYFELERISKDEEEGNKRLENMLLEVDTKNITGRLHRENN